MKNMVSRLSCIRRAVATCSTRTFSKHSGRAFAPEEENDVLFEDVGTSGVITLNRPDQMNSLSASMMRKIYSVLKDWETKKRFVIIKGAGGKAFCSGADLKFAKNSNIQEIAKYTKELYTLNHLVGTYKKPYIAVINGITMGAGVGISVYGKYRIATEKTLFAMPETAIGHHPDVGSSYVLSRLKGKLGMFLGLTGHRLKGVDVLLAGIATHYVPSDKLELLTNDLLSENSDIDAVVRSYHSENTDQTFGLAPHIDLINECFSAPTVEQMIVRLKNDNSEFARNVIKTLYKMSPTSLKITKRAIEEGSKMSFADILIMDYVLTVRSLSGSYDFYEGVRALLEDKDNNPMWNPKTLEETSSAYIDSFFKPFSSKFVLS